MSVAGPTSCGKTTWLKNVLKHQLISPNPHQIIWCYREWQPLYREMMQQFPNITFIEGIDLPEVDERYPHLIVLDDLMIDATKNKDVSNMFTVGSHHRNMSIVCLLQNVFYQGKENRTMSLNSHYLVLFKNPRDQLQVSCLARQMYPHNSAHFMEKFQKATAQPYGCLVVDLKQDTTEKERLKHGNMFESLHGEGAEEQRQNRPPGIPAYPHKQSIEGSGIKSIEADEDSTDMSVKGEVEEERAHSSMNIRAVNIMPSCGNCGTCFETPYFLKMHQHMGCIMPSDDDDGDKEEEKSNPWAGFLQQSFDKHSKVYNEKIDHYIKDGMSEKDAARKSFQHLMPKYKKSLILVYKSFLEQMNVLSKNWRHKDILQMLEWYIGWKGFTFENALEITLQKKRKLFEELIEEQEDDEDDEEKDEQVQEDDDDDIPLSKLARKKE